MNLSIIDLDDSNAHASKRSAFEQPGIGLRTGGVNAVIWRSVRWLEENFAKKVCIGELAALAALSPRHFTRRFIQVAGCTPREYLLRLRLQRAQELMMQSDRTVCLKQVADSCGFYDQTHFGRHFRKVLGTTPAHFLRAQENLANRTNRPGSADARRPSGRMTQTCQTLSEM